MPHEDSAAVVVFQQISFQQRSSSKPQLDGNVGATGNRIVTNDRGTALGAGTIDSRSAIHNGVGGDGG